MRIKFSENPEKFMDSEIELNDIIQEMHVISTRPDLYPIIVDSNTVQYLLSLLSHENIGFNIFENTIFNNRVLHRLNTFQHRYLCIRCWFDSRAYRS
jgi:hypothetical protein